MQIICKIEHVSYQQEIIMNVHEHQQQINFSVKKTKNGNKNMMKKTKLKGNYKQKLIR